MAEEEINPAMSTVESAEKLRGKPPKRRSGWGHAVAAARMPGEAMGGAAYAMARAQSIATEHGQTVFFWFAVFIHAFDAWTKFAIEEIRIPFYLMLWFTGWFVGFRPKGEPIVSRGSLTLVFKSLLFAALAFYWPDIWSLGMGVGVPGKIVNIAVTFFPPIPVYFFFVERLPALDIEQFSLTKLLYWVFIGFWIFSFWANACTTMAEYAGVYKGEKIVDPKEAWEDAKQSFIGSVQASFKLAEKAMVVLYEVATGKKSEYIEEQKKRVLGPEYQGQIDENAQKKLGVFIQQLKIADEESLFINKELTFTAPLEVRTMEKSPIDISFKCRAEKDKEKIADGIPIPKQMANVEGIKFANVNCEFTKNSFTTAGSYNFILQAVFSFQTNTYYKYYFITQQAMSGIRAKETDFWKEYEITPIPPKATQGPLNLKIKFGTEPGLVELDLASTEPTILNVVVETVWEGEATMKEIYLLAPKGIEVEKARGAGITEGTGIERITCTTTELRCDDDEENLFKMQMGPQKPIKKLKEYTFTLRITDPAALLGEGPTKPRSFAVFTDYDFSYPRKKSFTLKKEE